MPATEGEGDAGEGEDRDPGDDDDATASAREFRLCDKEFCHVEAPVLCLT